MDAQQPYWRASMILSRLTTCVVPHEAARWLMLAMRVLRAEAKLYSDGSCPDSNDTELPLFCFTVLYAELPFVHSNIFALKNIYLKDDDGRGPAIAQLRGAVLGKYESKLCSMEGQGTVPECARDLRLPAVAPSTPSLPPPPAPPKCALDATDKGHWTSS